MRAFKVSSTQQADRNVGSGNALQVYDGLLYFPSAIVPARCSFLVLLYTVQIIKSHRAGFDCHTEH